jgi:hypothetical protein
MNHLFYCPEFIRHWLHFKIALQQAHFVLFTVITFFVFLCSIFVVISFLMYKIDKFTNNYVDTKCKFNN